MGFLARSPTLLVGVHGIPQITNQKLKKMLVYEQTLEEQVQKSKGSLTAMGEEFSFRNISEYRNFVPSPRGTFGENKVPMIRLMELSCKELRCI